MQCRCGLPMNLMLRTVLFANKVTVHCVPVFSCQECHYSQIHREVKLHLSNMMKQLGANPKKQTIYFQDVNELAKLLFRASDPEFDNNTVNEIIHLRINELQDLLLLAESINDEAWVDELHDRLDQISDYSRILHEWYH